MTRNFDDNYLDSILSDLEKATDRLPSKTGKPMNSSYTTTTVEHSPNRKATTTVSKYEYSKTNLGKEPIYQNDRKTNVNELSSFLNEFDQARETYNKYGQTNGYSTYTKSNETTSSSQQVNQLISNLERNLANPEEALKWKGEQVKPITMTEYYEESKKVSNVGNKQAANVGRIYSSNERIRSLSPAGTRGRGLSDVQKIRTASPHTEATMTTTTYETRATKQYPIAKSNYQTSTATTINNYESLNQNSNQQERQSAQSTNEQEERQSAKSHYNQQESRSAQSTYEQQERQSAKSHYNQQENRSAQSTYEQQERQSAKSHYNQQENRSAQSTYEQQERQPAQSTYSQQERRSAQSAYNQQANRSAQSNYNQLEKRSTQSNYSQQQTKQASRASNATSELDDLMSNLEDFNVNENQRQTKTSTQFRTTKNVIKGHQTMTDAPEYASITKKSNTHQDDTSFNQRSTSSSRKQQAGITESRTTTATKEIRNLGNLENIIGSIEIEMNKQGLETLAKGSCHSCRKAIVGQVITALGRTYHPEHFACAHCKQELGERTFFERDGECYCEPDYHNLFAPKCSYEACGQPITGRQKCVSALNTTFHAEHFFCAECNVQFTEDKGYHEHNNQAYCAECYLNIFASKCIDCDKPITSAFISALNAQWHPHCFVCTDCRCEFAAGAFFEYEGRPYCEVHFHAKKGTLCAGCHKPITGRCVTAMFRKFHPEHFVCSYCLKQLNKGTFKEQNDKPYCHSCFERVFS